MTCAAPSMHSYAERRKILRAEIVANNVSTPGNIRRVRALASSVSVEGKKTRSLLLGTWLVHSLAHELAARCLLHESSLLAIIHLPGNISR